LSQTSEPADETRQTDAVSGSAPIDAPKLAAISPARFSVVVVLLTLLVALFLVIFFYPYLFVTIHAGERGVMWSRWTGTEINAVYLEGTQFVWPWNKMVVYDVRFKTVPQQLTLLSNDGLTITVSMMVRYRPVDRLLPRLHEEVGPDYAKIIVLPEVATALRKVLAEYSVEDLYESKFGAIRDEMLDEAVREAGKRYVILDDVMFTDIELPGPVSQAIQHKIQEQQGFEEMKYVNDTAKLEAERKLIEAQGIEEQQRHISNTLTDSLLKYKSIEAVRDLAASPNAKIVLMNGSGSTTPVILSPGDTPASQKK
jgi:prohibitin 1